MMTEYEVNCPQTESGRLEWMKELSQELVRSTFHL
jgi:hypothetical protein